MPTISSLTPDTRRLALDILRCPVVDECLRPGGENLGCYRVARWYSSQESPHYVPEPWSGHLDAAPILFISSNPGGGKEGSDINTNGTTDLWSDDSLVAAFDSAFDKGQVPGIEGATHLVDIAGNRSRAIRYLSWLWYSSRELLQRDPMPGHDYAASEVVHCGTASEIGVDTAFPTCTSRYFTRVMSASAARVVICVGAWAARAFVERYGVVFSENGWGPGALAGRDRVIIQVPHPNRHGARWAIAVNAGEGWLKQARDLLSSGQ